MRAFARFAWLSFAFCSATQAHATETGTEAAIRRLESALTRQEAEIDAQRARIEAQQREIAALRESVAASARNASGASSAVGNVRREQHQTALRAQEAPRWSMDASRPVLASADNRSTLALRALTQLDGSWYDQDSAGSLDTDFRRGSVGIGSNRENTAASDLSAGTNFRRARIGIEGIFARDFGYRFMAEFGGRGAESQSRINDAWVSYSGFAPFTVQMGAFSPPANMDDSTSAEDTLFPERSTPAELSRALAGADGRLGLGIRGSGARWMGALTLTGGTTGEGEVFDEQRAVVGRMGVLALTGPDNHWNLHLGTSGSYVFRPADQYGITGRYALRLRDRPELRVDGTRLIDTGPLDAEAGWATGLEFGANWRNLYLQAERFRYGVERRDHALEDPGFDGYYVQGSWVITGESRRYNMASGSFQAPRPSAPFSASGGPGSWELAWRYSHMDLDDDTGLAGLAAAPGAVRGGIQDIRSIGLNWAINSNLKLMLDYMRVEVERLNPAAAGALPFGPAPLTPPAGVEIGQDLDIFTLRTQFAF
jgi:phosphate-selective porin OprO/OprP